VNTCQLIYEFLDQLDDWAIISTFQSSNNVWIIYINKIMGNKRYNIICKKNSVSIWDLDRTDILGSNSAHLAEITLFDPNSLDEIIKILN